MRALIAALSLLWGLLGSGTRPLQADEQQPEWSPGWAMRNLMREFQAVEQGLAAGDAQAVAEHADRIHAEALKLDGVTLQRHPEAAAVFNGLKASAAGLSKSLEEFARAKQLLPASRSFEDLRAACVECHAKFRDGNDERGLYPEKRNAITGQVTVLRVDATERTNRSNVVVFLDGPAADAGHARPARTYRISQKDASFEPRVLPVEQGSTVEFPNDDLVFHNVFSQSATQPFDLGAYGPGRSSAVEFKKSGLVKVYCNIHPQMASTIVVLENPCFALTDQAGLFVIHDVPDGAYVLRTWHEFGGESREDVEVKGSVLLQRDLRVQEDKTTIEHKNKFGKAYRDSYK